MYSQLPYVVLVGDVGSGKSTLYEKLTGIEGRSSAASVSFTRESEIATVQGKMTCTAPPDNWNQNIVFSGGGRRGKTQTCKNTNLIG